MKRRQEDDERRRQEEIAVASGAPGASSAAASGQDRPDAPSRAETGSMKSGSKCRQLDTPPKYMQVAFPPERNCTESIALLVETSKVKGFAKVGC